ncbi:hypothetical protein B0H10DRAFT_2043483 [Mycena sp. CBHHK59/15]|nr:hypothetical protein B0H10DRAFT_2043483 [Mycena sp. CBHHK59/15]
MLSKLPLLYKDNLCIQNVIVSEDDPTIITSVIDWEGTVTAPIWDIELNAVIWDRVGKLNPAWAEAMAEGAALRDARRMQG